MAVGDIGYITPITVNLTTTTQTVATVPANEAWTVRFIRATCILTTGTAPTVSVGLTSAVNELCFNEQLSIPGTKNILGPDFITVPGGTTITARCSADNTVRLVITGTKEQIS